jgi:hypothetical protein
MSSAPGLEGAVFFFFFWKRDKQGRRKREVREDEFRRQRSAQSSKAKESMHRVVLALFDSDEQLRSASVENTSKNRP